MVTNRVNYVRVNGWWLVSSNRITRADGSSSIRSYDGSFMMGNHLQYQAATWQSEEPATLEEIAKHAPQPYITQDKYREMMEQFRQQYYTERKAAAEGIRRGTKIFLTAIAITVAIVLFTLV